MLGFSLPSGGYFLYIKKLVFVLSAHKDSVFSLGRPRFLIFAPLAFSLFLLSFSVLFFESGVIFCFMNLVAVTSVNHIILFSPTLALCANMVFNVLGEFQNERHVKGPKQAVGVKESIWHRR